jgi:hypothetical protein
MAKQEAEWSNRLSIFFLKKHGYLPAGGGWRSGGIKWTYGMSGNESSVGFTVITNRDEGDNIRLQYTHTSRETDEKESMDFRVPLATTACNYGGKRYWFVCPLTKNGKYCGRRVGVLYCIGKWFGCRHCGEIAYAKQMEGGKFRWNGVSIPDIEKAEKEVKRCYYNGKPTRKYRRVMRLSEKLDRSFILMAAHLDKRFSRFAPNKK